MAVINPALLDVAAPTSSGLKAGYLGKRQLDGSIDKGLKRGFGGPTATNGVGNTTDKLFHDAITETYDDSWAVSNVAVDDSAAVNLIASPPSHVKKIEIYILPTDDAIYIGPANSVTATGRTRGRYLPAGSSYVVPIGPNLADAGIWARCATGESATVQVVTFA